MLVDVNILLILIQNTVHNIKRTQNGIIYMDEIDKIKGNLICH